MINKHTFCISQINNGIKNKWPYVYVSYNVFVGTLLKSFYNYGVIDGFFYDKTKPLTKNCCVFLKYHKGVSLINKIIVYSSPGNSYYLKKKKNYKFNEKRSKKYFFFIIFKYK